MPSNPSLETGPGDDCAIIRGSGNRQLDVYKRQPLQRLNLPGIQAPVYAKREDLGPIRAYKLSLIHI